MAQDRTSGFDMLVQVSEAELNTQLATAFLAGTVIPSSMSVPVNQGGIVGTADLNFLTPTADLDRPRPRLGLTLPFANSQLAVTAPLPIVLAPLGGIITIVDRIQVIDSGANQIVTMDFNDGAPDVTVTFDPASQGVLAPVLAATGLTLAQAQNLMAGVVLDELQSGVQRVDLTPPIPVADDTDPVSIFDIDVTTVNDASAADRDCITFGVRMASDSGGNINLATSNFIPAGSPSLVMMSNFWLLAKVMRPRVAASLGRPDASDFDTPLRLNNSIPAPGGTGTLTALEARVIGNRIRVDGQATASGTGWDAVSDFSFFIDIALAGGAITVTATTPTVDTDVDLAWWVWLLSLGLGALFGGIVGAIIAAIVLAVVEAVAEGIVNGLLSGGITGSLGAIPAIPLGPIGGGLTLSAVILDDLELRGSIIRRISVPIRNQGQHAALGGFTLDLDSGAVAGGVTFGTDLIWDPAAGISVNGVAGLTITGASYYAITPVQVSRMPLTSNAVPLGLIPFSFAPWWLSGQDAVFGVRTSEGRYAKVRAWRAATEGGALHLEWVTFDTPAPRLDIAARWSVIERGDVVEYVRPDCAYCRSSSVRRKGVIEAWPRLVAFPIDYEWCLCGKVIAEGDGEVPSPDGPLWYRLRGRHLEIETDLGQDVDCELCVSAIDARGQELFTCIRLSQRGTETVCRKCTPSKTKFQVEVVPAIAGRSQWRLLPIDLVDKVAND